MHIGLHQVHDAMAQAFEQADEPQDQAFESLQQAAGEVYHKFFQFMNEFLRL